MSDDRPIYTTLMEQAQTVINQAAKNVKSKDDFIKLMNQVLNFTTNITGIMIKLLADGGVEEKNILGLIDEFKSDLTEKYIKHKEKKSIDEDAL